MTDKTELEVTAADDGKEYVIRKGGYFYRPKAEGYTSNANDAGRFSLKQAILHSFPNGPDGPRDGITYELATRTPDPTPVALSDEEAFRQLHLLYNYIDDDSIQFTRWQMVGAMSHGMRLAHPPAVPADGLVEALAELQLSAFLAGRGSVTGVKNGTRVAKPGPTMDDFRRMVTSALAAHRGEA